MSTMTKIVALASLCLLGTAPAFAQSSSVRDSAKSAKALQNKWFHVDNHDLVHRFTIHLDNGESLIVRFRRLSDWQSTEDLTGVFNQVNKVMAAYKDSLSQEQNTYCLDVHIPASQKNLITRLNQYNEAGNLMTVNDQGASVLKLGTDTLRILRNKPVVSKVKNHYDPDSIPQIQYTFLLKQLGNYQIYANDAEWQRKTAATIDSLVKEYRDTKKPDAPRHGISLDYYPAQNKAVSFRGSPNSTHMLNIDGGFGISLVRNTLCPNAEYGIAYTFHQGEAISTYLRLSMSAFYRFSQPTPDHYKGYGTSFVNLELGAQNVQRSVGDIFYKTSIGFGYKFINKKEEDRDPSMDKHMYRMFFNYHINKFFVFSPEVVSNFRKGDRNNSWIGVSLNFRLF